MYKFPDPGLDVRLMPAKPQYYSRGLYSGVGRDPISETTFVQLAYSDWLGYICPEAG